MQAPNRALLLGLHSNTESQAPFCYSGFHILLVDMAFCCTKVTGAYSKDHFSSCNCLVGGLSECEYSAGGWEEKGRKSCSLAKIVIL